MPVCSIQAFIVVREAARTLLYSESKMHILIFGRDKKNHLGTPGIFHFSDLSSAKLNSPALISSDAK